ncbi:MAG: penicillin-binding protein 2 [Desulfobacteraceae bacterium]|nr:penicillin-binding protein 2 [Desulfobacteraceae bacterium]MBC2755895.1 penicillin-binding protein 2 [Desulfobacteraceae bacterium]
MAPLKNFHKYFYTVDSDWYKRRLFGIMIAVFAAFGILASRLFYLQIIQGDHYFKMSKNNCIRIQRVKPVRGLIFDRNGKLLVENRPSFDLSIIPCDAKPLNVTIDNLSVYIPEFADEVVEKIQKKKLGYGYRPVLLKKDIGRDALATISAHRFELPGIVIDTNACRNYIYDALSSHLVGYLGEINAGELKSGIYRYKEGGDFIGRYGVEKAYDTFLSGIPGGRIVQVNANGQVVKVLDTVEPEPGHNIFLTIDYDLQTIAEAQLKDKVGAVVAMDPSSGDILAMASSPTFNQNDFINGISSDQWHRLVSDPNRPMMNKAVQGVYPPASTYKVVTAIAALEEGVIDENTTFYCPGSYQYGNRVFGCWKKQGHGKVNVVDALAQSCDVFFYHVGKKLGVDRLAWYATSCGLGSQTGINLDQESDGLIPTAAWKKKRTGISWQGGENLSIAIGQSYNLVTPLQLAVLFGAVANGGTEFRPQILKSIQTVEGKIVKTGQPEMIGKLPVSQGTLDLVRKGLRDVVHSKHGTARWYVYDEEIDISGKTGTAQVVSRKTEKDSQKKKNDVSYESHAWFVGYAPTESPEIVVSVLVEHGMHGSSSAGPIAKEMIVSYLKGMIDNSTVVSEK